MTTQLDARTPRRNHKKPSQPGSGSRLNRTMFRTSRLLDFCSQKELITQTGHPPAAWPLVILKELVDNSLDACEDNEIVPEIAVTVDTQGITVADNGPGLPASTIHGIVDFSVRVSNREAYVAPDRGAQGNALKTLLAMPFVLDGEHGRVEILAQGTRHEITFQVDRIRQQPDIAVVAHPAPLVKNGTTVRVQWPESASSLLHDAKAQFLQLAECYTFVNPHLSLTLKWFGEQWRWEATTPHWPKWRPSNPTCPSWYTEEHLSRLIAGYLTHEREQGAGRTVREFVTEFRGLTSTAKQKAVLEETGLGRMALSDLASGGELDRPRIRQLLAAMQAHSTPIKPAALGIIGKDHLAHRFAALGCEMGTFV